MDNKKSKQIYPNKTTNGNGQIITTTNNSSDVNGVCEDDYDFNKIKPNSNNSKLNNHICDSVNNKPSQLIDCDVVGACIDDSKTIELNKRIRDNNHTVDNNTIESYNNFDCISSDSTTEKDKLTDSNNDGEENGFDGDEIRPFLINNDDKESNIDNKITRIPKSIVKSPSAQFFLTDSSPTRTTINDPNNSIIKSKKQRPRLSLQPSITTATSIHNGDNSERHVQFIHSSDDDNDEEDNNNIIPTTANNVECRSPIGSLLSDASSVQSTSSSSSSSSSSLGQYSEARPPDGGWGWVVVFAAFMVNMIADGITFSFGVIFVEFLNYFGEGKAKTAWIGSLFMAMPLLSGPISSFLTDRYGCRNVTIVGSILACTGFVASSFAQSMEMLFFTFGILAGFGLSLCYVAAVVIVAYYFDKRRSFATGLSVCGSGIGTFLFAPITQMLLEEYGWRGTTLILAGAFLNMTVCGMLMRDLEWTTHRAKRLRSKQKNKCKSSKIEISADSFSVSNSTNTGGTGASNVNQQNVNDNPLIANNRKGSCNEFNPDDPRLFSSLINLPTFIKNGEKVTFSSIIMYS